jgi:hypothetical protein
MSAFDDLMQLHVDLLRSRLASREVAEITGLSYAAVCSARRALGCHRLIDRLPDDVRAALGVESDAKVAARLGVTRQRVWQIRRELGISRESST